MDEKMFNLLDEHWICVIDNDCKIRELSLLELFERAHEYTDLRGELATQDIAVLRVLLAVLHTVFSRYDLQGREAKLKGADDALDRWEELWNNKKFPMEPIQAYLETQRERFWLFHPDRPFYQCYSAKLGTEYTAAKLNGNLSESNNKVRLFPVVSRKYKNSMSFSEAARWLINMNAFDDTSAKPSSMSKKINEKLPSPGAGWLGKLGLLIIEGNNLFETLMLNMVMLDPNKVLYGQENPIWEREAIPSEERREIPLPDNLSELYTLQSRRLLLKSLGEEVTGYYLLGGDFFDKNNAFLEPMTLWRQQKSKTEEIYSPCRHDASKQFWREFGAVVLDSQEGYRRPGVISWLNILDEEEILEEEYILKIKIASVQYGDKDFFIANVFSDSISLHSALILDLNPEWREMVINRIEFCGKVANYIWKLAHDIDFAAGGDDDTTSKTAANYAKEKYYLRIDDPFRRWLGAICPQSDNVIDKAKEWTFQCLKIAENLGKEIMAQVGLQAIFGRKKVQKEERKESSEWFSAADAMNKFMFRLKKAAQL